MTCSRSDSAATRSAGRRTRRRRSRCSTLTSRAAATSSTPPTPTAPGCRATPAASRRRSSASGPRPAATGTRWSSRPRWTGTRSSAACPGLTCCAAADASLARLRTDYIDLYYVHYDDPDVPVAEAAGVFSELQKAGKIRHVGLSNYTAPRLREWFAVAAAEGFAPPVALQPHYNLVERAAYEDSLAPGGGRTRARRAAVLRARQRLPFREVPRPPPITRALPGRRARPGT